MKLLWHGTRNSDIHKIFKDGLSSQFSEDTGLWGRAIYFADQAAYSNNYSTKHEKNIRGLFLAFVLTGNHIEMAQDSSLRVTPDGFDSVKGITAGSEVYMIYHNERTYPMFYV